jgi:predicted GIY-YIG superfamily endonuclease
MTRLIKEINLFDTIFQNILTKYDNKFEKIKVYAFNDEIDNDFCKNPLFNALEIYDYLYNHNDTKRKHTYKFIKKFNNKEIIKQEINIKYISKNNKSFIRIQPSNILTINGLIRCIGIKSDTIASIVLREFVYTIIDFLINASKERQLKIINPIIQRLESADIIQEIQDVNLNNEKNYVVYFIKCGKKNIKIGYSGNIQNRLIILQTNNHKKAEVIHQIKCDTLQIAIELEKYYHNKFAQFMIHGEWFAMPDFNIEIFAPP